MATRLALSILATLYFSSLAHAAPINGLWLRGDGNAKVRIGPCGDKICAVNEWVKRGTAGEKTGDRLVMQLQPDGETAYRGTARDPQRGLSYRIKINVGNESMTTRGCVLGGLICRAVDWSRLQ